LQTGCEEIEGRVSEENRTYHRAREYSSIQQEYGCKTGVVLIQHLLTRLQLSEGNNSLMESIGEHLPRGLRTIEVTKENEYTFSVIMGRESKRSHQRKDIVKEQR